ncbi:MAG: hypothetical protein LBH46_02795 [Rickettsiales bacterium]|jgi:hypothetical protein|nr:hypothetical protein [Rickettsiales bacterium]
MGYTDIIYNKKGLGVENTPDNHSPLKECCLTIKQLADIKKMPREQICKYYKKINPEVSLWQTITYLSKDEIKAIENEIEKDKEKVLLDYTKLSDYEDENSYYERIKEFKKGNH